MMECDIIKSPTDKKLYKHLKLANGISVLLIHDPAVAEALAADGSNKQQQERNQRMKKSEDASEGSDGGTEDSSAEADGSDMSETGSHDTDSEEDSEADAEGRETGKATATGSKKAAAALVVGVGSFSDPTEMPGLSHYLEHMLFMGSEKYPDENEYDSYLTKNGGSSNAFTELEFTNYHFDVSPGALHGALDRFAQFFVAPLFQASALEREVQAVDSEFMGVLQSDHSRLAQLMCHTSRPGHIYNKFSWGNLKSLWEQPRQAGIDVRQRIIDYYRHQYGPARMNLVVLGGEPLDQVEEWVREMFGCVAQGKVGPAKAFSYAGQPFEGRRLYIVPAVKEHHEVTVTFQLPCLRDQYTTKPDHYISHLVGHEGPGSLLSALKARGWATELCAGVDDDGYSANTAAYLFTINIVLTEAGLNAGPGYGLAPVALLFQYLKLLTDSGPQQSVWEELKSISGMKFRFAEEEDGCDLVTRLASSMGWVKPQDLLVAEYLHQGWQPDKVMELLSLMDPVSSSYRIDLLTKSYDQLKDQLIKQQQQQQQQRSDPARSTPPADLVTLISNGSSSSGVQCFTEPWFNMDAVAVDLPDLVTASWRSDESATDLALPPKNPYIPSDFDLKMDDQVTAATAAAANGLQQQQQQQQQQQEGLECVESWMLVGGDSAKPEMVLAQPPAMILDESGLRVWHKLASVYNQPRLAAYFRISSPAAAATAAAAVLCVLWLRLIEEQLSEDAYLADVAGLHWSCSSEGLCGVEIRVDGFSHKLDVLAGRVFGALAQCKVDSSRFPAVHEQLLRRYKNALLQPSKAAAAARLRCLSGGPHWSHDQIYDALKQVKDVEEVQAFAAQFLSCCHMECLMIGNITKQEATNLANTLSKQLRNTPTTAAPAAAGSSSGGSSSGSLLPASDRLQEQCVKLPDGVVASYREVARNSEEQNCCVEVYYQVGLSSQDFKLRVLTDLADQILYEPLYDTLRTKQQLGYTVSSGARLTYGVSGFYVVVVSAAFEVGEVEQRIEQFMMDFQQLLRSMSPSDFEGHKSALISNKLQKDTALQQEGDRWWEQVFYCRYEFLCKEQEVAMLQQISMQEFQQFYDTYLAPTSPQRRKLSVQVYPATEAKPMGLDQQQQQQRGDAQQQQQQEQQHVQHEIGVVTHQPHHVTDAAAKVHAGTAAALDQQQQQQQQGIAATAVELEAVSPTKVPRAKRQRKHQQQQGSEDKAGSAAAAAAALLPAGMQQQQISDVEVFRQRCERYPVYCTVKPVLQAQGKR